MTETPMEQTEAEWQVERASLRAYARQLKLERDEAIAALSSRAPQAGGEGRCLVTGNLVGTDTWQQGKPCQCFNCQAWLAQPTPADAPKGDATPGPWRTDVLEINGEIVLQAGDGPDFLAMFFGPNKKANAALCAELRNNAMAPKGDVRGALHEADAEFERRGYLPNAPIRQTITAALSTPSQDEGELREAVKKLSEETGQDFRLLGPIKHRKFEPLPFDMDEPRVGQTAVDVGSQPHALPPRSEQRQGPSQDEEEALRSALFLANRDKESILRRLDGDIAAIAIRPKSGEINETLRDGALGALRAFRAAIVEYEWTAPREYLTSTQKLENIEDAIVDSILAEPAGAEGEALRRALERLVAKLDAVHSDERFRSVWMCNQIHRGPYDGPTYTAELGEAREALSTPSLRRALEADDRIDELEEAVHRIAQWADAYPLDIFPEPDLKKAADLLKAGGITIDSISAHVARHVIEGVGKIAREALSRSPKPMSDKHAAAYHGDIDGDGSLA